MGIGADELEAVTARERAELARRVRHTARAAIEAIRRGGARRVVLAIPVAPDESVAAMRVVADEVVVVETPPWFFAIDEFYEDFAQTSDEEVVSLLKRAAARSERVAEVPARS